MTHLFPQPIRLTPAPLASIFPPLICATSLPSAAPPHTHTHPPVSLSRLYVAAVLSKGSPPLQSASAPSSLSSAGEKTHRMELQLRYNPPATQRYRLPFHIYDRSRKFPSLRPPARLEQPRPRSWQQTCFTIPE